MRAPLLYWICVAYLAVAIPAAFYRLYFILPQLEVIYRVITISVLIAYGLGALALLFRRKFAVVLFLVGFGIGVLGFGWAVAQTGPSPSWNHPEWVASRVLAICVFLAIVFYSWRLSRRGFLH